MSEYTVLTSVKSNTINVGLRRVRFEDGQGRKVQISLSVLAELNAAVEDDRLDNLALVRDTLDGLDRRT